MKLKLLKDVIDLPYLDVILPAGSILEVEEVKEEEEPKRWRAAPGLSYWCMDGTVEILEYTENKSENADRRYKAGNYYRTKAEAEAAQARVLKAYRGDAS